MHIVNRYCDGEYEVLESNQGFKICFNKKEYIDKYNEVNVTLHNMLNTTKVGSVKYNKIKDALYRLEYLSTLVNRIMYTDFDIFNALNKTSKGTLHKNRNIRLFDTGIRAEWFNQIHGTDLQLVLRMYDVNRHDNNILRLRIEFNYKHKTPSIFDVDNAW